MNSCWEKCHKIFCYGQTDGQMDRQAHKGKTLYPILLLCWVIKQNIIKTRCGSIQIRAPFNVLLKFWNQIKEFIIASLIEWGWRRRGVVVFMNKLMKGLIFCVT